MNIIAWTTEAAGVAELPLLGMPCRAYVEAALRALPAVLLEQRDAPELQHADVALVVRPDAPALTPATLLGLARAALAHPCALMSRDLQTPLAVAVDRHSLLKALGANAALPTVDEAVEALDAHGVAPSVWHDSLVNDYWIVKDAQAYAEAHRALNQRNIAAHLQNGVILLDPERTVIESGVTIGAGTMVYAGNTLEGTTRIGKRCVLYPNNRMQNASVGDGVTVESSVLLDCSVGSGTTVGPYAYLRPHSHIGERCRIGDFVEIKNSAVGDGTKVSHLTYVGDSDLGKDINLGCGVVFVNYDGKAKSRSRVDDHAFIGCNCNLVAPVHIGENAYLAAGGTVTEDVPADALFLARSRGVIKEGWVKRRKDAGKL